MSIHLGEIGLTNLAGPTGPPGTVSGSGAATRVAFWTNASTLSSDASFTFSSITKILSATEVDIGATPFKFLETAGVLQLGDAKLFWTVGPNSLTVDNTINTNNINDLASGGIAITGVGPVSINGGVGGIQILNTDAASPTQFQSATGVNLGQDINGNWSPLFSSVPDLGDLTHPWGTGYFATSVVVDDGAGGGFVNANSYKTGVATGVATATFLSADVVPQIVTVTNGIITSVV